jgi:hypothetical protein
MTILIQASLLVASLLVLAMGAGLRGTLAVDLNGRPVEQLAPAGTRAVVLFFAASDCPISNRYIPEVQRLAMEVEPLGVRVWFVYPNPGDNAAVVRAHDADYAINTDSAAYTVLDTRQTLVKMAHVTITPEAAIFVPEGSELHQVYRGRIDDRYLSLGTERPQATHHDLEEAVRAVVAGRPVPQPGGPTVGCSIVPLQP